MSGANEQSKAELVRLCVKLLQAGKGGSDLLDVGLALLDALCEAFAIVHLFLYERGLAKGEFELEHSQTPINSIQIKDEKLWFTRVPAAQPES